MISLALFITEEYVFIGWETFTVEEYYASRGSGFGKYGDAFYHSHGIGICVDVKDPNPCLEIPH